VPHFRICWASVPFLLSHVNWKHLRHGFSILYKLCNIQNSHFYLSIHNWISRSFMVSIDCGRFCCFLATSTFQSLVVNKSKARLNTRFAFCTQSVFMCSMCLLQRSVLLSSYITCDILPIYYVRYIANIRQTQTVPMNNTIYLRVLFLLAHSLQLTRTQRL
jgi:hypothetical protein